LKKEGFSVEAVANGREALHKLERNFSISSSSTTKCLNSMGSRLSERFGGSILIYLS
jgi:CheY-like chemotaxis protein